MSPHACAKTLYLCRHLFLCGGIDYCTGTSDGPLGERWAYLSAANINCLKGTPRSAGLEVAGCLPGVATCGERHSVSNKYNISELLVSNLWATYTEKQPF